MKFLFVLRQLAPGGAELSTQLLGQTLQRRGHQIQVLSLSDYSAEEASHWQGWASISRTDKQALRRFKPEPDEQLILVDQVGHRYAPRNHTISIIHSDCNAQFRARSGFFGALINRFKARHRYRGREILVSRAMATELSHWSGREYCVIANPFDADRVRRSAEAEPQISLPTPYILHIGRISTEKRQDRLIEAYANNPALHGHRLVFVGGEQDESKPRIPALQALAGSLGVAERVHFTGNLYNPYPLLKKAACLVLCSDTETMGYVLLEAMTLNIPMVSTVTTGAKEVLGSSFAGLVEDNNKLGDAIAAALQTPALFRMPLPEGYDAEAVADAFEAFVWGNRSSIN